MELPHATSLALRIEDLVKKEEKQPQGQAGDEMFAVKPEKIRTERREQEQQKAQADRRLQQRDGSQRSTLVLNPSRRSSTGSISTRTSLGNGQDHAKKSDSREDMDSDTEIILLFFGCELIRRTSLLLKVYVLPSLSLFNVKRK